MVQKDGYGLFGGSIGEGAAQVVAPELHSQGPNCGVGDQIGDARELDVERPDGEVSVSGGGGDESLEGVGWGVELPGDN